MKKLFLVLFFALLFSSCIDEETNLSPDKLLKYEERGLELKKHLDMIALELRANNAKLSDQDAIIAAAKSNFGEDSANFSSF